MAKDVWWWRRWCASPINNIKRAALSSGNICAPNPLRLLHIHLFLTFSSPVFPLPLQYSSTGSSFLPSICMGFNQIHRDSHILRYVSMFPYVLPSPPSYACFPPPLSTILSLPPFSSLSYLSSSFSFLPFFLLSSLSFLSWVYECVLDLQALRRARFPPDSALFLGWGSDLWPFLWRLTGTTKRLSSSGRWERRERRGRWRKQTYFRDLTLVFECSPSGPSRGFYLKFGSIWSVSFCVPAELYVVVVVVDGALIIWPFLIIGW